MLRDATGYDLIASGDVVGSGGRHSRDLMDAPTERLPVLAKALAWFPAPEDDTDLIGDDTETQIIRRLDTNPRPLSPGEDPWTPPPREVMEKVLEGLKNLFTNTPEGDEPDRTGGREVPRV